MKLFLRGINPWLPVLAFVTLFHILRGAYTDALIFGAGAALLIADWKKLIPWHIPNRPLMSKSATIFVILVASSVLFFSDRGGWQDVVLLLALIPISLTLVYYRDYGPKPSATKEMARTKWLWLSLAIAMALAELFAYIWASIYKDDESFPTISILVNPFLETGIGRAVFLTLWMLIGVGLLGIWRKK